MHPLRPGASQLVVLRDGEPLIDAHVGAPRDALFMSWSSYKPMLAVLVMRLAREGALDLDAPVAWLWPEFAAGGKGQVSTRDVLRHRSGLDIRPVELAGLGDPERAAQITAGLRARRTRRDRPHYQVLAYGVVLGEIIRRVTGRSLNDALQEQILDPLGLEGYLGLPAEQDHRGVHHSGSDPIFGAVAGVAGTGAIRRSPIASGGFWTNAMTLARFYEALAQAPSREEMTAPTFFGRDGTTGLRTRWGTGIQLGVAHSFFGSHPNPRLFGHNGSNIAIGWHDPATRTSVGMLNQHIWPPGKAVKHLRAMADYVAEL